MLVGVDEAGRGCVFGPLHAAAVIWDPELAHKYLKDSKRLTPRQRAIAHDFIVDNAIDFGIGSVSNFEIDSLGVQEANMLAMHRALDNLVLQYDEIAVDGICFKPYRDVRYICIAHGDAQVPAICAASILAKEQHDIDVRMLVAHNRDLERYLLLQNKGYATRAHCNAVQAFGRTQWHRHSFRLPFEK